MKFVFLFLSLLFSGWTYSQQHQVWFRLYGSRSITENKSIYAESDFRPYMSNFHTSQYMFRAGLNYKASKSIQTGLSFSRFQTVWNALNTAKSLSWEYRLQQDLDWKHSLNDRYTIHLHGRLDERFYETHTSLRTRAHFVLDRKIGESHIGLNTEYHYQFNLSNGESGLNQFREELYFLRDIRKGCIKGYKIAAMYQLQPLKTENLNNLIIRLTLLLE